MQSQSDCEVIFPTGYDVGLLVVPTKMGVLEPSGNGLYLQSQKTPPHGVSPVDTSAVVECSVALNAQCVPALWHPRFGDLNM
jgi:hypothetical protein